MFYYLSQWLLESIRGTAWEDPLSWLRVFQYISFRSAGAAVTALAASWLLGPWMIRWLRSMRYRQEYADERTGEIARQEAARRKIGVPTMGGLLIVAAIDVSALLWARWTLFMALTLLPLVTLAGLGFLDDYTKLTRRSFLGASARLKFWAQVGVAAVLGCYLWWNEETRSLVADLFVPFIKHPVLTGAPLVGVVLTILAVVGSSNAVNLTDGLDGLAIGCVLIVTGVLLVMTYIAGNVKLAEYLLVPYVPGAGELTVICAAILGAGLGFLWYNCHPAEVFMGDTGSLALGGVLGIMAVLIQQPFVLLIAGGVFVMEAVSVMVQVSWFRYTRKRYGTGRRVFLCAPIHHHFQYKGWAETKVVTRFYILGIFFAVIALATLKVR
ncbi:MAG: phospho-N-acetylmuramoyl-pentapeptide-transferase [Verrucomicrobia bacterium]|nr:MAG: phospho-N-acetylmuramoyl-pentapeptide-transferase [Verrucomicrobiota bacterium]